METLKELINICCRYLTENLKELINVVSESSDSKFAKLFDFSHLKYKERDELEDAVRAWKGTVPFDVESLRDQRLRGWLPILVFCRVA